MCRYGAAELHAVASFIGKPKKLWTLSQDPLDVSLLGTLQVAVQLKK